MTKDNNARFTFRLPDALYAKISQEAEKLGVSRNSLILQILWDWAKKNALEDGQEKGKEEE